MMALVTRREFLKAGLGGSVLLACSGHVAAAADDENEMLAAVARGVLAGVLPASPAQRKVAIAETVAGVRRAIAGLSVAAQKEVGELFTLLTLAPTRRFVAGVSSPWIEAGNEEVAAFLNRWRYSRFALLQGAYAALHDLVLGAWYARPEAWPTIGYPGTPEIF
jgi:hypothetical protein